MKPHKTRVETTLHQCYRRKEKRLTVARKKITMGTREHHGKPRKIKAYRGVSLPKKILRKFLCFQ